MAKRKLCILPEDYVKHLSKFFQKKVYTQYPDDMALDVVQVIKDNLIEEYGGQMADIVDQAVEKGTGKKFKRHFFNPNKKLDIDLLSEKLRGLTVEGLESDIGLGENNSRTISDPDETAEFDDRGFIHGATNPGGKISQLDIEDFDTFWVAATNLRLSPAGFNQLRKLVHSAEKLGKNAFDSFKNSLDGAVLDGKEVSLPFLYGSYNNIVNRLKDNLKVDNLKSFLQEEQPRQISLLSEVSGKKNPAKVLAAIYKVEAAERNLKTFFHAMRNENRTHVKKKNRLIYTNLNFRAVKNALKEGKDIVQAISNAITSFPTFVPRMSYNLDKKKVEGEYQVSSFIDNLTEKIGNFKIGEVTGTFSISQMVKLVKTTDETRGFFTRGMHQEINENTIMEWEYALSQVKNQKGQATPLVITGLSPGDTGDVYLTNLQKSHIDTVMPKNDLIKELSKPIEVNGVEVKLPSETLKWIKSQLNDKSIYRVITDLQKMYSKGQDQLREASRQPKRIKRFSFKKMNFMNSLNMGKVTQTSRPKRMGKVGDTFKVGNNIYEITKIVKKKLGDVISKEFKAEGFEDAQEMKDFREAPLNSKRKVYVHEFKKIDEAREKELISQVESPSYQGQKNREANLKALMRGVGIVARKNIQRYFNAQASAGYMSKEQADLMIDSAIKDVPYIKAQVLDSPLSTKGRTFMHPVIHFGSVVAKYEWMQGVRGPDFMLDKNGDIYNIFDRLRIPVSKGLTTLGMGESRNILYDQEKVEYYLNGEKFEHMVDIPGIGLVNIFDGASFASEQYLDDTAENSGFNKVYPDEHNMREVKTVVHEISRDENGEYIGYIEKKHAEHSAIPGLEIRDKKTGDVIASMVSLYGKTRIVDNNGRTIDTIGDLDATKASRGMYDIKANKQSSMQFNLKENSRRIIITPHTKSADDVSMPVQMLSAFNMPLEGQQKEDFNKYTDRFYNLIQSQADKYLELYENVTNDKEVLWDLVKQMFDKKANLKHNLEQLLSKTNGKGLLWEGNMTSLRPIILNRLIKRGSMQARTMSNKLSKLVKGKGVLGSHYVLKPGLNVNQGQVILSADNHVLWDGVAQEMEKKNALPKQFSGMSKQEKLSYVNEWLQNNDVKVLTWRFPILQLAAIETRTIQAFTLEDGNAIYHNPEDTFRRLVGDYDIDEAGVAMISGDDAAVFEEFYQTPLYQKALDTNANIGIIKSGEIPKYSSLANMRSAMVDLIHGFNAQGMATNIRAVGSTLSMKFGEIKFSDGVIVKPKKLLSTNRKEDVILDYFEVDDSITEDDIPSYASFVNEKGQAWRKGDNKKHLKTSVEHEYLLIANAAVDNLKKGTLTRVMGARDSLWYIGKMFRVVNGELNDNHLKLLRDITKQFKYSNIRRLRHGESRYKISVTSKKNNFLDILGSMDAYLRKSPKKYIEGVKALKIKGQDLSILDVEYNNNITYEEQFVLQSYTRYKDKFEKQPDETEIPLMLDDVRQKNTSMLAKEIMLLKLTETEDLTDEQIEIGLKLADDFADDFYGKMKEIGEAIPKPKSEYDDVSDNIVSKQAEYDKELFGVLVDNLPKLNSAIENHGDNVWKVMSTGLIYGLGEKSYIQYLPPVEILHDQTLIDFFTAFDNMWDKIDPKTKEYYSSIISHGDKTAKAQQLTATVIKNKMERC